MFESISIRAKRPRACITQVEKFFQVITREFCSDFLFEITDSDFLQMWKFFPKMDKGRIAFPKAEKSF